MEIQTTSRSTDLHELTILVFGVGGCGVNVVKALSGSWTPRFKGYLLDTDSQMFAGDDPEVEKIHLNSRATQGMSCAGDVAAGRHALNEQREQIAALCATADLVFIVAGFGGGTGTGAANALAEIASDAGSLVIGFATMPFVFEGAERRKAAAEGLRMFQDAVDGVVVVENERLLSCATDKTSLQSTFAVVADAVSRNVISMQRLLTQPGLVNIDFADVRRMVMNSRGLCTMAGGEAEGKDRAGKVIDNLLGHPLFCGGEVLKKSASVIVGVCGGYDLTLRELEQIMTRIGELVGEQARVKMGTSMDERMKNKISIILLASECEEDKADAQESVRTAASAVAGEKTESARKRIKAVQSSLNLESPGKGRFKDVEPTLRNGEDLDIPAFMRRGIKIRSNT